LHSKIGDKCLLNRSAIILAGGTSSRFGQDKGVLYLANEPLTKYVIDAISTIVDEKIIVTNSKAQAEKYAKIGGPNAQVLIDAYDVRGTLVGALTGFEKAHGKYSLLVPCDTPFISKDVVLLLFELCVNKTAAIPRWPNGYTEPLQAVYCTRLATEAAKMALSEGKLDLRSMVEKLHGVRYVSTLVLQQLDTGLRTFFNINTPLDLKKAENMLKAKK